MGQLTSPDDPPRWTFETRGSFTLGVCLVCGFRTPARRARYSAEGDLRAHALLCEAARSMGAEVVEEMLERTDS